MEKTTIILSTVAMLTAVIALGLILNSTKRLEHQAAAIQLSIAYVSEKSDSSLAEMKKILESELNTMDAKVEQQSMLLNRALGKVMPLVLPSSAQKTMADIEKRLANETKWPVTPEAVTRLNSQLADLVNDLPPWAQEELLPRMVPWRWELDALWFLVNPMPGDYSILLEHANAADSLLAQKPPSASDTLEKRLRTRKSKIETEIERHERQVAIAAAKEAIAGHGDIDTAARLLAEQSQNEEVKSLLSELHNKATRKSFARELDDIEKLLGAAAKCDSRTQHYTYQRVDQMLLDVRMRMTALGISAEAISSRLCADDKKARKSLKLIAKANHKKEEKKLRDYQKWALGQIKQVEQYDAVADREKLKIKSTLDRNNPLSDERKHAERLASARIRNELIQFMGQINQGLLDEAVNQLYRKIYQSCYTKLNKRDQLAVVENFAVATKRSLE